MGTSKFEPGSTQLLSHHGAKGQNQLKLFRQYQGLVVMCFMFEYVVLAILSYHFV